MSQAFPAYQRRWQCRFSVSIRYDHEKPVRHPSLEAPVSLSRNRLGHVDLPSVVGADIPTGSVGRGLESAVMIPLEGGEIRTDAWV